MSLLSVALNQCQLGTWWYENDRARHLPPPVEISTVETRQTIIDYLRTHGRTQAIKVQRDLGYTKSKFYHALDGLLESGQVVRHRVHCHCTVLEAA
jgi:hypothetical protein